MVDTATMPILPKRVRCPISVWEALLPLQPRVVYGTKSASELASSLIWEVVAQSLGMY